MWDAAGVDSDVKLAKILGYKSTGTISQWRSGEIPDRAISKISEMFGASFDEIKYGIKPYTTASDPDVELLIKDALVKYNGKAIDLTQNEFILLCTFRDMPDEDKKEFLMIAHELWAKVKGL